MLTQFLARAKPDSTQPKPRFMKNTSMPQTITQIVSTPTLSLSVAAFDSSSAFCKLSKVGGSCAVDMLPTQPMAPNTTQHNTVRTKTRFQNVIKNPPKPGIKSPGHAPRFVREARTSNREESRIRLPTDPLRRLWRNHPRI